MSLPYPHLIFELNLAKCGTLLAVLLSNCPSHVRRQMKKPFEAQDKDYHAFVYFWLQRLTVRELYDFIGYRYHRPLGCDGAEEAQDQCASAHLLMRL